MNAKRLRKILRDYEERIYTPLMDEFAAESPINEDLEHLRTSLLAWIEELAGQEGE